MARAKGAIRIHDGRAAPLDFPVPVGDHSHSMMRIRLRLWHGLAATALLAVAITACADTADAPGTTGSPEAPGGTGQPTITVRDDSAQIGVPVGEGDDFVTLRGHLFGGKNDALVILSHMRPNDQSAWFEFAEELANQGYAALTFDFRGYGETGDELALDKLDEDLAAILQYVRATGRQEIYLLGASMGGTASLVVAEQEEVDGVIAVSPPAEFEGLDALAAVANLDVPKLFIVSEDDTQAADFADLLAAAGDPKESETYSGDAHGTNLLQGEHAAAFKERIFRFLEGQSGS